MLAEAQQAEEAMIPSNARIIFTTCTFLEQHEIYHEPFTACLALDNNERRPCYKATAYHC